MAGEVKHPEIVVRLSGTNGNAYAIIGAVRNAMRKAGISESELALFFEEATADDYDHLLRTCMDWVTIE